MTRNSPPKDLSNPAELVVYDEPGPCPYLEGRIARLPLRVPARALSGQELDERLALGDRRQGVFLYRTECPLCRACEPIRIPVSSFRPSRTQRRVWQRGQREISVDIGRPLVDERRIELYNRHKLLRGLSSGLDTVDERTYRDMLASTCTDTVEFRYIVGGVLVGVALADRGREGLSAVYCYYDPDLGQLSLGTYSILTELELCRSWGLKYLYLGLYINESEHMKYKAGFLPHERLINGAWQQFDG